MSEGFCEKYNMPVNEVDARKLCEGRYSCMGCEEIMMVIPKNRKMCVNCEYNEGLLCSKPFGDRCPSTQSVSPRNTMILFEKGHESSSSSVEEKEGTGD